MTEAEAFELALQYMVYAHDLGEANHDRIQFWIGTSYVLLLAAYAAPQRMTIGVSILLLVLYVTFTTFTLTVLGFDTDTAGASMRDSLRIMEAGNVEIESVVEKMRAQTDEELKNREAISALFAPGLFLGVVGFVSFVTFKNWRNRSR